MRNLLKKKGMKGVDFVMVTVFVLPLEQSSGFDSFPPCYTVKNFLIGNGLTVLKA